MRFDVVTLFPEMFEPFLELGMVGRALRDGRVSVRLKSPREFGLGKHRSVDDTPYGGGAGMVMRVDCLVSCAEALDAEAEVRGEPERAYRVLLSPQGRPFCQAWAQSLASMPAVMLICGRYEGFDERVRLFVDDELSLGDFVLSGGEVGAMTVIDACARLQPGVLHNPDSIVYESHSCDNSGLLEYPQYTRPVEYRGHQVPEVLQSGNHGLIARWRQERALERTLSRRPDILSKRSLTAEDDSE